MTNGYPARGDSTALLPLSAPVGFPVGSNADRVLGLGYPDPRHADHVGLKVLRSAPFFIDAAYSKSGERYAVNQGTGGHVLDARYGSSTTPNTNDPLLLPWTAQSGNYVYLPGSASNTISCTAPAGTASYAACPVDGSAATTGAASAGAFTFQTTGSWSRLDLLDAGATVLASFLATSSAQTGYTDAYGVAWTINRSSTGRKTVVVDRQRWLLGTDDYFVVKDHPLLEFGTGDNMSTIAVYRLWGSTSVATGLPGKYHAGLEPGWMVKQSQSSPNDMRYYHFGITASAQSNTLTYTPGELVVHGGHRNVKARSASDITAGVDEYGFRRHGMIATRNTTMATVPYQDSGWDLRNNSIGISLPANQPDKFAMTIGKEGSNVGTYSDIELVACAVFRRHLTLAELTTICQYYGTI